MDRLAGFVKHFILYIRQMALPRVIRVFFATDVFTGDCSVGVRLRGRRK